MRYHPDPADGRHVQFPGAIAIGVCIRILRHGMRQHDRARLRVLAKAINFDGRHARINENRPRVKPACGK